MTIAACIDDTLAQAARILRLVAPVVAAAMGEDDQRRVLRGWLDRGVTPREAACLCAATRLRPLVTPGELRVLVGAAPCRACGAMVMAEPGAPRRVTAALHLPGCVYWGGDGEEIDAAAWTAVHSSSAVTSRVLRWLVEWTDQDPRVAAAILDAAADAGPLWGLDLDVLAEGVRGALAEIEATGADPDSLRYRLPRAWRQAAGPDAWRRRALD